MSREDLHVQGTGPIGDRLEELDGHLSNHEVSRPAAERRQFRFQELDARFLHVLDVTRVVDVTQPVGIAPPDLDLRCVYVGHRISPW